MMKQTIEQILREMGDPDPVIELVAVVGGEISEAYKVTTTNNRYFVKYHRGIPSDFFATEARGLKLLADTGTLPVPRVYHYSAPQAAGEGYIVLEWVEGERTADTEARLGSGLALLHASGAKQYGLGWDNYIGTLPQPNGWYDDWVDYLRERRLGNQAKIAEEKGFLHQTRKAKMERLLASLDRWVPRYSEPVLLHGDLWRGNWLVGPEGQPYLIDPAVFYGEREFELAFTELFGGFSRTFYDAYREIHPLSDSYEERRPLYQLYYLLVHLTHFGESYGPSVDRTLAYYVG